MNMHATTLTDQQRTILKHSICKPWKQDFDIDYSGYLF